MDWLLRHCPFSALAGLGFLVICPIAGPVPEPIFTVVAVIAADIALFAMRRWHS